jgi:hypothetical protein
VDGEKGSGGSYTADAAEVGNDHKFQSVFRPTAPGSGNVTKFTDLYNVTFVQEVGKIDIQLYLTTRNDDIDDKSYVQEVTIGMLPGF